MNLNSMQVSRDRAQYTLIVVVSPEELVLYEDAAFAALRSELELPGFRKGHVPETVARSHLSPERIFAEAVERAVAERGSAACEDLHIEFVGAPRVEVLKAARGNPLEFRIIVEALPEVPLADWRNLRVPLQPQEVGEQDVDLALDQLRRSRAKSRAVLREARLGDLVEVDFDTRLDGALLGEGSSQRHPLILGEGNFIPGFEDAIVGMNAGEEKVVHLSFPADWAKRELAGKEAEFRIKARSVQERIVPDLDEAFARSVGKFENLEDLRKGIREGLSEERRERERRRVRTEAVDRLGERIPEDAIPETLMAQERARMQEELRESIEAHGMAFADYLARIGKREEELAEGFREGAIRRVRAALVLRALAREEGITVSADEVDVRVEETLRQMRGGGEAGGRLDSDALRSYTENVLRNEKTLELIEQVVAPGVSGTFPRDESS